MKVFHRLEEIAKTISSSSVAIGNFDGVHLGHQRLLNKMLEESKRLGVPGVVLTFYPHPVELLRPEKKLERLFTTAEKLTCLEDLNIPYVLVANFDQNLASLSPEIFFENYLKKGLKAKSVTVGFDFHFGKARSGDANTLKALCAKNQIELTVVDALEKEGVKISSTFIREKLREGAVDQARTVLGRPYFITGAVSHGDSRGEKIGFPTANLKPPEEKLLPKDGVYVTRSIWQKQVFPSVTNIGTRPTFHGEAAPRIIEVHFIDFKARLYDEMIQVEFLERIRDEKKFSSVEELVSQIQRDVQYARDSFKVRD